MKIEKVTYVCDNPDCKKEITIDKDKYAGSSMFDSWLRVYMTPKAAGCFQKQKYHFCKKQCAVDFILMDGVTE